MLTLKIPEAFEPLLSPHRYKVVYGGRGSAKSWSAARVLLHLGTLRRTRILCGREIMRTIADSVHRLLSDQIIDMGLQDLYHVTDSEIVGVNGTEFLFTGLRSIDAAKVKSYEGVDKCWLEEAQAISKKSREILLPTIRAPGSEIWLTFNPELDSDDVWQYFVVNQPPNAWVQKVTYRDNPWFPTVLDAERQHLAKIDPEAYRYVWEGECRQVVDGAIYAREVLQAMEGRRIRPMPHDPSLPVHTVWDLGWNDAMSVILLQKPVPSAVSVIGYIEDSFRTYAEYVADLNALNYVWGVDYMPHDAANKDPKAGRSAKQVMEMLGRRVEVVPRSDVEAGIRSVRMMFPRVYFDDGPTRESPSGYNGIARLLECLKRYRRAVPSSTGEPGAPVHDEYSHGADAFRALAAVVDRISNDPHGVARRIPPARFRPSVSGAGL